MAERGNGGIIGPANVPNAATASGVWTLEEQQAAKGLNSWPGFAIQRSLRFNSADSAYLSRTPASAGNRQVYTISVWVKRSGLGAFQHVISNLNSSAGNGFTLIFADTDKLQAYDYTSGFAWQIETTQVFRDVSAWYHIVLAVDTTQVTASNRVKLYVNGSQVTTLGIATYPTQNYSSFWNNSQLAAIGRAGDYASSGYFNGYMTEIYNIDGQALTPSSFGITNPDTGVWQPKAYAGTYGTNGFYLNFSDNSNTTATTLGKDYSGNGNNWTPNNFSVSAGAGNDSLVDVPTAWGTDTGVGGTVRGNYCTWNPLAQGGSFTFADGNLQTSDPASNRKTLGTISVSSGKWYWEVTPTAGSLWMIGVALTSTNIIAYPGQDAGSWSWYTGNGGVKINNASQIAYGGTYTTNDVIGVALDLDAGTLTFYKNGVSQGVAYSGLAADMYTPTFGYSGTVVANFGQRPFAYTAPSGFKALCTQNLPTPTIGATAATQAGKYFNPVIYTAPVNSSTLTVTGVGFQPDFTWWKTRSASDSNTLMNVLSGSDKYLLSNSTNAEATFSGIWTPTSDGFTASALSYSSNQTYVAWNWKANGAGVTNTAGSITSTVSANTTSGFSVVKWNGSGNATIGHGLGVAPSMYIVKPLNNTSQWYVYFRALGAGKYLQLNLTATEINDTAIWQNTAPTSTVFSIGSGINVNNMVAYCFAEVPGFSKFGSYTGNGSTDGPFVYCGFRPAYVMVKCSSPGGSDTTWVVKDKLRAAPYNPQDGNLYPNLANAEDTISTVYVDFLSNGFKIRGTYGGINGSSQTYIFAAFAEAPQKFALAR